MKYLKLITNRYALSLTLILVIGLLCMMATSEWTIAVILIKLVGFALIYAYVRLFKKWDSEGKVDIIKELFNDDEEGE